MHIIHHYTISYYIIIMSVDRLGEASATYMKQVKGKAGRWALQHKHNKACNDMGQALSSKSSTIV